MKYWRCKCGKAEYFESGMTPCDCEGCSECGTTFAQSPKGHREITPHEWRTMYDENTGDPYRRCIKCGHKEVSSE